MPKSLHEKAKADLQDIWMAETKKEANAAFDLFVDTYGVKYEKAAARLVKDRAELLAFWSVSGLRTRSKVSLPRSGTALGEPRGA